MTPKPLAGKTAIVAGGGRGAGRGISLALGDVGATVYVSSRNPQDVERTAADVTARGGHGIPVPADLSRQPQVATLFNRVITEQGRLDVLAISAWTANFMPVWSKTFWDLDTSIWDETLDTVSIYWHCSSYAARLMQKQRHGLIVYVTDNLPDDPSGYRGQILHDLGHEALNRLIHGMSTQAKHFAVVGLNPGFMRTEAVLAHMKDEKTKKQFRFDLSESPEYIGRAVAALAAERNINERNGKLLWVCDLAGEYGFTDIDGRHIPRFDPHAPMQAYPC